MEVKNFKKKYKLKKNFFEGANWEHGRSKLMKDVVIVKMPKTMILREEKMFQVTCRGKIKNRLNNTILLIFFSINW